MLLVYKFKQDFGQNLPKVQIFHYYIINAFRLLFASNFEVDFSSSSHKCHFGAIFCLVLNRLRKTGLALQCIRVVVYRIAFFIKERLFSKIINWNPEKNVFLGNFWHWLLLLSLLISLLTVDKKDFIWFKQKKLLKISQKRGKIIYLYKSVNINFSIIFKLLSKLQESSCIKCYIKPIWWIYVVFFYHHKYSLRIE